MPVWEITGAEFTKHEVHTADGISVRFPRVTRIRDDKTWNEATSVKELQVELVFRKSDQRTTSMLFLSFRSCTRNPRNFQDSWRKLVRLQNRETSLPLN